MRISPLVYVHAGVQCLGGCAAGVNDTSAWSVHTVLQVVSNFTVTSLTEVINGMHTSNFLTTAISAMQLDQRMQTVLETSQFSYTRVSAARVWGRLPRVQISEACTG